MGCVAPCPCYSSRLKPERGTVPIFRLHAYQEFIGRLGAGLRHHPTICCNWTLDGFEGKQRLDSKAGISARRFPAENKRRRSGSENHSSPGFPSGLKPASIWLWLCTG